MGGGRNRWKRPRPDELGKFDTKTSRGPQHFAGPPRNETDITQNKKFRQCVFAEVAEVVRKGFAARREKKLRQQERVDTRTRLRSEKAVIYSPRFAFPHFSDRREFAAGHSGEGRESNSGGRAAWASFF